VPKSVVAVRHIQFEHLGAQLMARALGARVYPARAKEIGWGELQLSEMGRSGPLGHFAGVPVLHWYGDTFDLLASTETCANQAFSLGRRALACQFHPEIRGLGFERWLIGHAVEIAAAPGISPAASRPDTQRFAPHSARSGEACLSEWLSGLYSDPI
jgi:GMP synthase (glutamine-hydrolysing)